MKAMHKKMVIVAICIAAIATSAGAQTVTGAGTSGTVPVFTGTSAVGNSPIAVSGSNVGIGTAQPDKPLYVNGGIHLNMPGGLDWSSNQSLLITNAADTAAGDTGAQIWHGDAGAFGSHLLVFSSYPQTSDVPTGGYMVLNTVSGNVGIGTVAPDKPLYVNGGIHLNMPGGINWSSNQSLLITNAVDTAAGDTGAQIWHGDAGSWGSHLLIFSGYPLTSSAPTGGYMVLNTASGHVGIGTITPGYTLDVAGQIHSSTGYIFPDGTTQTTAFIPANCGADYAESVGVTGDRTNYEPGDILVIDPNVPGKFLKSNEAYSTMVAGIYSTKPGFVGRLHPENAETDKTEVPMAMVGRVPTKVSAENGPIKVGDLLVTSSTIGYAMKGTDRSQMLGAVVGKALGSLDSGTGVIEVLVTLQ
jgi:hypothetical protein